MLTGLVCSCNSKETDDPEYQLASSVAISKFYLKANSKVMDNLDSVFFSIDLDRGVVYNADSLPKGTDVSRLIPQITFASDLSEATLRVQLPGEEATETDYLTNPNDSIDFNGEVSLFVTSEDKTLSRTYTLKVNVHKMDPDLLAWDELADASLPSRLPAPKAQKSLEFGGRAMTFIQEADGTFTLSTNPNPTASAWEKSEAALPEGTDLRSLTASDSRLYLLADDKLHESADGLAWTPVASGWTSIIGGYGDTVLGLRTDGAALLYTQYPVTGYFTDYPADASFPVKDRSNFTASSSKWTQLPIGVLYGGTDASGRSVAATWGFDGNTWADLTVKAASALRNAVVVPYYVYRQTTTSWVQKEMQAWLLIGGRCADGSVNRATYVSYDSGVTWNEASDNLTLPDEVTCTYSADALVIDSEKQGTFGPGWTSHQAPALPPQLRRVSYTVDGYDVTWECPYIYLIGGLKEDGALYNRIWRGVLNRLTFVPLF